MHRKSLADLLTRYASAARLEEHKRGCILSGSGKCMRCIELGDKLETKLAQAKLAELRAAQQKAPGEGT
jgi:hypothetical protein